jgi:sec-independent protein translocase protein TatA
MMFSSILLFGLPQGGELVVIVIVVLLLFGGKKIPELMRGLGKGIKEFNDAKNSVQKDIEDGMDRKTEINKNSESDSKS